MRTMRLKRPKAPLRYEDIVDPNDTHPGLFRKLRLYLFLWNRPDELSRYDADFRARLEARYGKSWCDGSMPSRKELRDIKKRMRALRKQVYATHSELRELTWEATEYAKNLKGVKA